MKDTLKTNDTVHRAAANEADFRTRSARGSVCNGLLAGWISKHKFLYKVFSLLKPNASDLSIALNCLNLLSALQGIQNLGLCVGIDWSWR